MVTLRRRLILILLLGCVAGVGLPTSSSSVPAPAPGACQDGVLPGGALSRICVPASGWNGDLVVWAHGYVPYNEPIGFYNLTFGSTYLPDLAQSLGFAFATTSYRVNGLAALQAVDDVRELMAAFPAVGGRRARRAYMIGASEGGLVTTLLLERSREQFSGALAMCGPIGSFKAQIGYFGDFRVLFDYFFPGVLPGLAIVIPQDVIDDWEAVYVPAIQSALAADPSAARQLIRTSGAAIDPEDPTTIESTTLAVLWYNVFATNDAAQKLGGNPYGNRDRIYRGSSNDLRLNLLVQRYSADPAALLHLIPYETAGRLSIPLVTLHTIGDEIIPFWQERLYRPKVHASGKGQLTVLPVVSYGHCNFEVNEVLGAFALLLLQVAVP